MTQPTAHNRTTNGQASGKPCRDCASPETCKSFERCVLQPLPADPQAREE